MKNYWYEIVQISMFAIAVGCCLALKEWKAAFLVSTWAIVGFLNGYNYAHRIYFRKKQHLLDLLQSQIEALEKNMEESKKEKELIGKGEIK